MIFFCEDCGKKNDLGKANFKNGKAVFRCDSCHYLNSYTLSEDLTKNDILLKKIVSYPIIIGAFLYQRKNRVIANHMPEILHKDDLEMLGSYLTRSYLNAQSLYSDIDEVMITISDKHIIIQKIAPDLFIFIVSTTLPLPDPLQELLASAVKKDVSNDFS